MAVRPGLRIAFSRASRPVRPRSRSSGRPVIDASGRTSRGENSDTPKRISAAPPPTMDDATSHPDGYRETEHIRKYYAKLRQL